MNTTRRISAPDLTPATIETIDTIEIDIPPGFGELPHGHQFGQGWTLAVGQGYGGEFRDIVGHGVRLSVPRGRGGTYFEGPVEVCIYPLDPLDPVVEDSSAPTSRGLIEALASATEVADAVKAAATASSEAAVALAGLAALLNSAAKAAREAVQG